MKKFLSLVTLLLIFQHSYSQELAWASDFEAGYANNVQCVRTDALGNTWYAGSFEYEITINGVKYVREPSMYEYSFIVVKDKNGGHLWTKILHGGQIRGIDLDDRGNGVVHIIGAHYTEFEDGYKYVPGWGDNTQSGEVLYAKYDVQGNRKWVTGSVKPPGGMFDMFDGVSTWGGGFDTEGNYYSYGVFTHLMAMGKDLVLEIGWREQAMFVSKISADGVPSWIRRVRGNGMPLGGGGAMKDGIVVSVWEGGDDFIRLVKFGTTGNVVFDRPFKPDSSKSGTIITTSPNSIYVSSYVFDKPNRHFDYSKRLITRLDLNGNSMWEVPFRVKELNTNREYPPQTMALTADKDDRLYVLASGPTYNGEHDAYRYSWFGPRKLMAGDYCFARMNPNGTIEWSHTLPYTSAPYISAIDVKGSKLVFGGRLKYTGESAFFGKSYMRNANGENRGYAAMLDVANIPAIPSAAPQVAAKQLLSVLKPDRISLSNALNAVDKAKYEVRLPAIQPGKGIINQLGDSIWYTPRQEAVPGLDTFALQICGKNGGACSSVQMIVQVKEMMKVVKDRAIVNPGYGYVFSLGEWISDPNNGILSLGEQLRLSESMKLLDGGELQYSAWTDNRNDTLRVWYISTNPEFENDLPVSKWLQFVFESRTDVITSIPSVNGAERQPLTFSPNPLTLEAYAKADLSGCAKISVLATDTGGKTYPVEFTKGEGRIGIRKGALSPGIYIISVHACRKMFTGKILVL